MKTRAVIAAICLLIVPAALFAQTQGEEWYVGKPIKDFSFTGLVTVKADSLAAIVKPYIGKIFTIDLYWEVQGKLFALDSFETIEGEAQPSDDAKSAVVVVFKLKERPAISSIEITGNANLKNGEILDKILLKRGDLASEAKVKADESAIKNLYLDKGYTDATVSGRITTNEKDNTAVVTFDISEGSQTTIKEVRFSGNSFASESTLRNLMKTKPPFLFDTGVFQESKLEEDKRAITDYYTDHGYVDAKIERVEREVLRQDGKNFLNLTIYLTEGLQWTYGGMKFEGNVIFPTQKLSELVYQKPGKILSLQKLMADYQRVIDLYSENGYIFNTFDRKESRDEAAKTITYTMSIVERDKAHIENIIFKGNTKTAEYVLRRELPFEEGDIFNRNKVIEGWRNLVNLQFFGSVQPDFPMGSAEGLMNIVFNVEETSTADINFGIMFSGGEFPVSGTVKWNERNFMGHGQTLGVDLEASPIRQLVALNFYEPWMLGVRWSAGVSLSVEHDYQQNILQDILSPIFTDDQAYVASTIPAPDPFTNYQDYLNYIQAGNTIPTQYLMTYDAWNIGLALTSGYRYHVVPGWLGVRGGVSTQFRYITYDPAVSRPYEKTVRDNLNQWNIIDKISGTFYLDGRDYFLNPTMGYQVSETLSYAGGFLLGTRHYNRTDTDLMGFLTLLNLPVSESWNLMFVLAAHSGFSLLLPQFAYITVPGGGSQWQWTDPVVDSTDLLYIDGMTVGRGWTQTYGQALWNNSLELRMPIAKDILWAVGFLDAVGLWATPRDILAANFSQFMNSFYFSFGFGLRFTIPQFPIRVYLDKKFQVQNGVFMWRPGTLGDPNSFWNFDFTISLGGDVF